jgi:hypothetical protein
MNKEFNKKNNEPTDDQIDESNCIKIGHKETNVYLT